MLTETNRTVAEILSDKPELVESIRETLGERFLKDSDPSIVFHEYLNSLEKALEALRSLYYRGTKNRNKIAEDFVEIVNEIEKQSILAREQLQHPGGPEDVNESDEDKVDTIKKGSVYFGDKVVDLAKVSIRRRADRVVIRNTKFAKELRTSQYPPLFWIDGKIYKIGGEDRGALILDLVDNQNNAYAVIRDLDSQDRKEFGLEKLLKLF